jgi:porphobilinogen synthase
MIRMRRLRRTPQIRRLFAETEVGRHHLVQAYFVVPGTGVEVELPAGSGLWRLSADRVAERARRLADRGVGGVMLFGVGDAKTPDTGDFVAAQAPLVAGISAVRESAPGLPIFADVCLCGATDHGHCGHVTPGGTIDNDRSVVTLAKIAVHLAEAGADFVCPSDMMDGRIGAIRTALDDAGLVETSLVSYAVKMASGLYGPFRAAADSKPAFGDRSTYQMPAGNRREARREALADVAEGADMLLYKPALTNLDLIRDGREASDLPIVAYQVSGEFAMIRAAANAGWLDEKRMIAETLLSIRRAGADLVVTYAAETF